VRFQAVRAVKMTVLSFRVVTPCGLTRRYTPKFLKNIILPRDSIFIRNVGIYLRVHTATQRKRLPTLRNCFTSCTVWFVFAFVYILVSVSFHSSHFPVPISTDWQEPARVWTRGRRILHSSIFPSIPKKKS